MYKSSFICLLALCISFALSCGGSGSGIAVNSDEANSSQNSENSALNKNITLKTSFSSQRSKAQINTTEEFYVTNAEGEKASFSKQGNDYETKVSDAFIEGPLLVVMKLKSGEYQNLQLEPELQNNTIDFGKTDRVTTTAAFDVQNQISNKDWLLTLKSDNSLRQRMKTRLKNNISGNVLYNNLTVSITGTGNIQGYSRGGNIMFNTTNSFEITHNSNIAKEEFFTLVYTGPADFVIRPDTKSFLDSFTVTKGNFPYESGARYRERSGAFENSTFIDHIEYGLFPNDIKVNLVFKWINNNLPTINSTPSTNVVLDKPYSYQVNATDADGDILTYKLTDGPHGMTMDKKGLLSWPSANVWRDIDFTYTVTDGQDTTTKTHTVTVQNIAPQITSSAIQSAKVNELYNYSVIATDPDGDTLQYSLISHPTGMTIGANTGVISFTPVEAGTFPVTILVKDDRPVGMSNSNSQSYYLTILP